MSRWFYAIVALLAAALILVLIFFVPEKKSDNFSKTPIWDKVWKKIEYYPQGGDRPAIRFLRERGFFEDNYYVETPVKIAPLLKEEARETKEAREKEEEKEAREEKGGKGERKIEQSLVRRTANSRVKNIFFDWLAPELKGIYLDDQRSLAKGGFKDSQERVEFYTNIDSNEPVVLKIGNSTNNGQFVQSSYHNDMVVLIPDYLIERLRKDRLYYREKKIVRVPTGSHIENINLSFADRPPLSLIQTYYEPDRKPAKKGREKTDAKKRLEWFWDDSDSEKKLSKSIVSRLEGTIKRLQIEHFEDEEELQQFTPALQLWQKAASNYLNLQVGVYKGNSYSITIRKPTDKILVKGKELLLIRNSRFDSDKVDYVTMNEIENLEKQTEEIVRLVNMQKAKAASQPAPTPADNSNNSDNSASEAVEKPSQ